MSNNIIRVKNLKKVYKLYDKASDRLREAIHPLRKVYHTEFEALSGISFDIFSGKIVGIIGKNGSGKSTLLKILTGVLTPSAGDVEVKGKIAALLELGAGFNPELTGRENIYLNGLVMGFTRDEMSKRINSIVEFAEIGEYIDQPVRMYSSGMFVRLAFSVAINVDADILIVDEALSVGDVRFQQKCIRKMQSFFSEGKTVLYVGHDLAAINSFCSHCIWLNEGKILSQGEPSEVTKEYSSFMAYGMLSKAQLQGNSSSANGWLDLQGMQSFGDRKATISRLKISDSDGNFPKALLGGEKIIFEIEIDTTENIQQPILGFSVKDRLGNNIFGGNTYVHESEFPPMRVGKHCFRLAFTFPYVSNGSYLLTMAFADGVPEDHIQKHWIHDCFVFQVENPKARYRNGDGLVLEHNFNFELIKSI